jgi:hypothetical protein
MLYNIFNNFTDYHQRGIFDIHNNLSYLGRPVVALGVLTTLAAHPPLKKGRWPEGPEGFNSSSIWEDKVKPPAA